MDDQGRVLLVKHSYGRLNWEIPGGGAEPDETPTETVLREVLEETGLSVEADRLTGVYHERQDPYEVLHFVFRCHPRNDGVIPRPACAEITACAYWPVELLPRPINDFTVRRIQDALHERGPALPVVIGPRQWLE